MSILKKTQIDYKWVILIVCFVMEFFVLGFCSSNAGLYTKSVTEALDIPRSLYSIGNSIRYVAQILVAMTFGHVISRFGVKKVAGFGFATLAFSVVVRAIAANIIHIYIGNVLWGIGIVFSGNTIAGTIIRRWFKKDVGRYTGIVMSANGIGGAIAAQIITPFISSGTFGYRKAYICFRLL
ncbi:MAG: MFS transporter [Clostridia bacterium]|nr:MFS transporter [Clostridia bacterium]MBQ2274046.1 MFS transporter [Clostridia bacterium]MBQ5798865.1 MFS transporter [Clostridia bacterium]